MSPEIIPVNMTLTGITIILSNISSCEFSVFKNGDELLKINIVNNFKYNNNTFNEDFNVNDLINIYCSSGDAYNPVVNLFFSENYSS